MRQDREKSLVKLANIFNFSYELTPVIIRMEYNK
jgi:hypothetical protein